MGKHKSADHYNQALKDISQSIAIPSVSELYKKVHIDDLTAYVVAEAFTGNPFRLIGQVIEIRKKAGKCPENFNEPDVKLNFSIFPIPRIVLDKESILKKPELRSSIVVNKELSAKVGFLNYLSAELDENSCFSLMVFDQAKGLVDSSDPSWTVGVNDWISANQHIIHDPEVCYLYAVIGFVQKNIVRKKYVKFQTGVKGGGFGVNINGELAMSTDEYSVDIIFGLTPAVIKRPGVPPPPPLIQIKEAFEAGSEIFITEPDLQLSLEEQYGHKVLLKNLKASKKDLVAFASATGSTISIPHLHPFDRYL